MLEHILYRLLHNHRHETKRELVEAVFADLEDLKRNKKTE